VCSVDEITDFFWSNCEYLHYKNVKSEYKKDIQKHMEYKTLVYLESEDGIIGACRFNINDDTANILDVAVDKRYRNQGMLDRLFNLGHRLYPSVKIIHFHSMNNGKNFNYPIGGYHGQH
jgi:hypothetical protein